jgi:glycosyltransferase involved in cell wall biosynthesis
MRLLVLNYEYPPLGGGAGNATFFLAREWGKLGHTVDIVTTGFGDLDPVTRESENVTVYRVRSLRKRMDRSNPLEMLSYVRQGTSRALDLCNKFAYDKSIAFFSIPSGIVARKLFLSRHVPYVVLLRGGDVPGFLPRQLAFFHWITMPLTKMIWQSAERVIANSNGLRILAEATGKRLGIAVEMAPNGVDADFFSPPAFPPPLPFRFLFAGRFSSQKNLLCLLRQFENGPAKKGAKLDLVGDGPERPTLVLAINSTSVLSASVAVHPWLAKDELRNMYRAAHCFVNPSLCEGLPNTILEAMSCGLPVVASDVGGNNELVFEGKNGHLFQTSEENQLAKCMEKMMVESDIDSMRVFSRNLASTHFSWSSAAAAILGASART